MANDGSVPRGPELPGGDAHSSSAQGSGCPHVRAASRWSVTQPLNEQLSPRRTRWTRATQLFMYRELPELSAAGALHTLPGQKRNPGLDPVRCTAPGGRQAMTQVVTAKAGDRTCGGREGSYRRVLTLVCDRGLPQGPDAQAGA